jgi:hypothetical protein
MLGSALGVRQGRQLTTACTRPRIRLDVIENLSVITSDARRVMPGVMPLPFQPSVKSLFRITLSGNDSELNGRGKMMGDDEKLIIGVRDLRKLIRQAQRPSYFDLGEHFTPENIVEIAKSQFPRLEAKVAMHHEMERTKRLLIVVAAFCLIAGGALVVFAPQGKEGVSYVVAASIVILSLGAVGVQEFRIRTVGVQIEGGIKTLERSKREEAEQIEE